MSRRLELVVGGIFLVVPDAAERSLGEVDESLLT
jgi:hypothetical protein